MIYNMASETKEIDSLLQFIPKSFRDYSFFKMRKIKYKSLIIFILILLIKYYC